MFLNKFIIEMVILRNLTFNYFLIFVDLFIFNFCHTFKALNNDVTYIFSLISSKIPPKIV